LLPAGDGGEDAIGVGGPGEGSGVLVVLGDVAVDGGLEVPASRPRVTKWGGVYYGKPYATFLADAQKQLAAMRDQRSDLPVVMVMEVICAKPPTGKLELPKGDVDNYAKGPLDAATKAATLWKDDAQVAALFVAKRYAEPGEEPGVSLEWAPLPAA
jgi:Holliday junction resolvase RusA-like endonuclease